MKNDAYGEVFGSLPSWLPFSAVLPRNACRSLVALELQAAQVGVGPAQRASTPLFGPRVGEEWYHSLLEEAFETLLEFGCGLDKEARHQFSLHSFSITLACALYAAKCPNDKICAILRWKSEDSLKIYARMNDYERTSWILRSFDQHIDSSISAHLPQIDPDAYVAHLRQAINSGELESAAAAADAGELDDDEPLRAQPSAPPSVRSQTARMAASVMANPAALPPAPARQPRPTHTATATSPSAVPLLPAPATPPVLRRSSSAPSLNSASGPNAQLPPTMATSPVPASGQLALAAATPLPPEQTIPCPPPTPPPPQPSPRRSSRVAARAHP
jgi:hypothetical protein